MIRPEEIPWFSAGNFQNRALAARNRENKLRLPVAEMPLNPSIFAVSREFMPENG